METREKQAYLIEAHKCDEMLLTLLRMLDVPWNDIFIHMDSKNTDYQPETVECRMKYAKVFHAKRHSVVWGGVSQVKAELVLLKTAVAHGPYQHYHLISGVDLPIQTQEDIRAFFEANPDVEFVHFDPHPFSPFNDERVYYRHFFQNIDLRRPAPPSGARRDQWNPAVGSEAAENKAQSGRSLYKGQQLVQLHGRLCTVSADKRRVDPAGAGQDLLLGRVLCADTDRAVAVSG